MPKKSKWYESAWKVIGVFFTIVGGISALLQIFGAVDFWNSLIVPLYTLLTSSVSIYYVILILGVAFVALFLLLRFREHRSNILDHDYGRWLAELCQTPRTTDYLREKYEDWESRSRVAVIGGYDFEDYMKRLEKQGYLKYRNGKWEVTDKALDYIDKYHGD